jgi:hypothetical protein
MKGFWKWFLIVVGALILIGLIATPFVMHSAIRAGAVPVFQRGGFQNGPGFRGDFDGNPYLRGNYRGMPMMRNGMMPIGGLMMLPVFGLFCLIALAVLGFAVYGIVALVNRPKAAPVAAAPVEPEPTLEPCTKCGHPLQPEWNSCPNCGQKVRKPKK